MNIRFLGTSFGAPAVGRHQQSILLETDCGDAYLIDAGAPVLDILVNDRYDLTKIKAIFITHLHGDHMNGLMDILNLSGYFGIRCDVYLSEQRGIDAFSAFLEMMTGTAAVPNIHFRLIREGGFYDDGNLQVTGVATDHMEKPSYGFLLSADGSRVYITGDLHPSLRDFPAFLSAEDVDMIVAECAHFSPEELYAKIRNCRAKQAAVIHVMPEGKYAALRKCALDMPIPVLFPQDGDTYSIG
ncbi:MAG: MBL fold metallo-hydrolase [Clostridia bacterium]|nr:MBL fold metallo-hydrolase [Clostridia bacterium]